MSRAVMAVKMTCSITLETAPARGDIEAVRAGLRAFNLARVPELLSLPAPDIGIVARDEAGNITSGVYGSADWGWFYVDTLWVDEAQRGQGLGRRLMAALEGAVLANGISRVYLATTGFQALDFYRKLGYEIWGELADRPNGYGFYYLRKESFQPMPQAEPFEVQIPLSDATRKWLDGALLASIAAYRPLEETPLLAFIRSTNTGDSRIVGGIVGATFWDWFDLRLMWVDDNLRGQGYGARLLALAEAECIRRGVYQAVTDTADFQALPFYLQHGFSVFGTLSNRPPGHTSYYLRKTFQPEF